MTTIDWTLEAAEKGGYEHFMLKEMHEQPEAIRQSLTGRILRDDTIHASGAGAARGRDPSGDAGGARRLRHAPHTRR